MATWKTWRTTAETSWDADARLANKTKSRLYMLGSFFELIKTVILDDKDDKAIEIKADPAYYAKPSYKGRTWTAETTWKTRQVL